jgi:hypothetical protein
MLAAVCFATAAMLAPDTTSANAAVRVQTLPVPEVVISAASNPSVLKGPTGPCSDAIELAPTDGHVQLSRTGDVSGAITVTYSLGGSAQVGVDYLTTPAPGAVDFGPGKSTATISFSPRGEGTIDFRLLPGTGYQVGEVQLTTLTIRVKDTGFGCGPPTFTKDATNTVQRITVGQGLARLRATPFPRADDFFALDSGGQLPSGVTLNENGTFSGTAKRAGSARVVIGACTPAGDFSPQLSRDPTCALTVLTVTVVSLPPTTVAGTANGGTGNGSSGGQLAITGAATDGATLLGLCLLALGFAIAGVADRRIRFARRVGEAGRRPRW